MRALIFLSISLFITFGFLSQKVCAQEVIKIFSPEEDVRNKYPIALLKLALDKSGMSYELKQPERRDSFSRILKNQEAKNDARVDVVWTLATPEFEQGMDAVYIPIDRGLLGWRLLLTRSDMLEKLAEVDEQGLKNVRTAMSHDWIDLRIMRESGFNCLSAPDYTNLFKMLRAGRIQYISRSVNEIYREIIAEGKGSFVVDPTWAIYYPAPLYFFVDKEKAHVRDAIEKGLRIAIKEGSMKVLFNDFYEDTIKGLRLEDRKILRIEHRYLSENHPFDDPTLWFDIKNGF